MILCCCDVCPDVHSDTFTGTVIDTAWEEVAGTWTQNNTITTTSTNALLITDDSVGSQAGIVTVQMGSGTRLIHRIIGAYTDANNYIFAEITNEASSFDLELYERVGGADTLLEENHLVVAVAGTLSATLCWDGTNALIEVSGTSISRQLTGATTQSGQRAGIGTGATATSIQFDNFGFVGNAAVLGTCAPCSICRAACGDGLPATLEVTLPSAWSDVTFPDACLTCNETFNGQTFVLEHLTTDINSAIGNIHAVHGTPSCSYAFDIGSIGGGGCQSWMLFAWFSKVRASTNSVHTLTVVLQNTSDSDQWFLYKVTVPDKAMCSGQTWELIYDSKGVGTGARCDFNEGSPGTVLVVAA